MRSLLILPCFLAVLLVACGGNSGSKTPTPSAVETSSPEAVQTAEAAVPDPFASLSSYNYDLKVVADAQITEIKGSVQAPDRITVDVYDISTSDQPVESVVAIGSQYWGRDTSTENQWIVIDATIAEGILSAVQPKDFWSLLPVDQLVGQASDLGEENVNGVASHHLQSTSLSADDKSLLASFFLGVEPGSGTIDIWRADNGGWLVKAQISVNFADSEDISSAGIDWQISNVNSSSVSVQPPL